MSGTLRLVEMAHASNTGRVREHNEDRYLVRPPLLAVADGMGGAKAGEVAAQITVETLGALQQLPTADELRAALIEANVRIRTAADDDSARAGMGTTATAAIFDGTEAVLMHVGDSRGYLYRGEALYQLTDDHSVVAEMVRQGQLLPEEAERHRSRNIITRALGAEPDVEVDEVHVTLHDNDMLLLCSDGLSSLVRDVEMAQIITQATDTRQAVEHLVTAALEQGGNDNITVVLARFAVADPAGTASVTDVTVIDDATQALRIPPAPTAVAKPNRTPSVLEPTPLGPRARLRRALALGSVGLMLIASLAAWISSRTYFVDGKPGQNVLVAHGAPITVGGVSLFGTWSDTGVPTTAVTAVDSRLLGRSARGQGDAVHHAVSLIWRFGLPTLPQIVVPPPPSPKPKPASKPKSATSK